MSQQQQHVGHSNERQIQNALYAIKQDATFKVGRAAAIFSVPRMTLSDRCAGRPSQADR
jgi:hypothetical protein